ncbi:MAG: RNA polymerase sigma factor [Ktedonobacterales bacterium]
MRDWRPTRWLWASPWVGALAFSAASTPTSLGGLVSTRAKSRAAAAEVGGAVTPADVPSDAQLAAMYREFSGQIHTYAYHLLGSPEDADDITQEVFIRAYARLTQLREQTSMRSWLYRIATNLCMDQLRRRSRVKRIFGLEMPLGAIVGSGMDDAPTREVAQPMATAEIDSVAERDHIALALKRMPDKYAICLLLHSQQGLSYREIADVVGITPGAAAVRLSRARDLFARYYEELKKEGAR